MMAVDLRDREALQRVIAAMQERLPRVDYFFCNAGKSIHRKIEDALERMHDYDRTMDLNYRALVALSLSLMPLLKMGEARIVYTCQHALSCCSWLVGLSCLEKCGKCVVRDGRCRATEARCEGAGRLYAAGAYADVGCE